MSCRSRFLVTASLFALFLAACGGGDASPKAVCQKMMSLSSAGDFELDDCAGDLARLKEADSKLYGCMSKCAMSASSKEAAEGCIAGCESGGDERSGDPEIAAEVDTDEALEPLTFEECETIVQKMAGMAGIEEFWPPHSVKDDILESLEECARGRNDPEIIKGYRCMADRADSKLSYATALDRCW